MRAWSRLQTTLVQITQITPKWVCIVLKIFNRSRLLNNWRLSWKQSLPWNFSLFWIYFLLIRSFEQLCACPEKQSCPKLTVLNIFFTFRIFELPVLSLKNRVCPEIFHCIEISFIIQDFWATCACPENRVALEFFTVLKYLLSFGIFEQIVLALKTEFALKFFKPGEGGRPAPDPPARTPMLVPKSIIKYQTF